MLLSLVISLTIIIIFANLRKGQGFFKIKYTMFVTFIIVFTLLSVIYTATICLLMKVMDKVNDEKEFRKEKISILLQFFFFLVAFVSRAVFYGLELYNLVSDDETYT